MATEYRETHTIKSGDGGSREIHTIDSGNGGSKAGVWLAGILGMMLLAIVGYVVVNGRAVVKQDAGGQSVTVDVDPPTLPAPAR